MGGWLGAIGSIFSWIGGEGIGATLARLAIGLGISKLLNNTNDSAAGSASTSTPQGTRQQISAATDNKLPVAYGDSYFSGTIVDMRVINDNKEMFAVIDLCEVTGDIYSSGLMSSITIDELYMNNQRVVFKSDGTTVDYTVDETGVRDDNASNLCGIYLYGGSSNNPMLPAGITGTVPPVAYEVMPGWDNTYTNQNKIFAIIKVNYDPSKGLHTIPTVKFHVKNTLKKFGDCILDYATNVMYGAGIPIEQIDLASIAAANAFGDEMVTLGTYPAQPRYRINGLVRTTETVFSNMEKLAAAGGSIMSFDIGTGKWAVVLNKSTAKTLDFDDSNILGQVNVNSSNIDALFNKVEVQFPYKVLKDQYNYVRFDLPEIFMNANEPANTMQITHEFVNDPVQATILANLDLRQSREDVVITFKTDYSKYNTAIGTVIGVTNSVYGWTDKLFKVIRVKKNESDSGQLTLEVTAQAYNEDVYTVEDISDFVPLIGAGHSLPSLTPIQQPLAPLVSSTTLSSQPAVFIQGTVPEGVVTEMEFWYTADTNPVDNDRLYTLLGTMRAENGGPFTIGDTATFKTVLLASGNYYFKVRANNNGRSTSKFSPPSAVLAYTYVQAPDVLKYTTPTVDENGSVEDSNGMNIGLMAAYLGYKLFEKPIDDYLKELFGITDEQADKANTSVAKDEAASVDSQIAKQQSDAAVAAASSASGQAAAAQSEAAAASAKADAALAAALAVGANVANVTITSTLSGQVFPSVFGSGEIVDANTHAGIFTHDNLVFAGSNIAAPGFISNNVVTGSPTLNSTITGTIQNFYTIPDSSSWEAPPQYTQTLTDKFAYDSTLSLYYATATYTSGNLDAQSWSTWKLLSSGNGVSGTQANTAVVSVTYTNPYVEPNPEPYRVDAIYDTDGYGNMLLSTSDAYDPFLPNVAVTTTTYTEHDTRHKELTITLNGNKTFTAGETDLIIFGTSPFKLPDGTPFANNTAFGHVAPVYRVSYPNAISFTSIANNGTRFVGIATGNDKVYWSDDGYTWTRISLPDGVTTDGNWFGNGVLTYENKKMASFDFIIYDGSKFLLYDLYKGVASSTDGKVWTEEVSSVGLDKTTKQVIGDSGHYLSVCDGGIQSSIDGIDWTTATSPAIFETQPVNCACWDGSKFVVGSKYNHGKGSAMYSSTDGVTWSKLDNFNTPSLNQAISNFNNKKTYGNVSLISGLTSAIFN